MADRKVVSLKAASAAALLASGLMLAGASVANAQKAEPCIGASLELTGPLAHTGKQIVMGAEVAIDEINAAGGVLGQKLKFLAYDDQGEPSRAVDNGRRIGEKDNCIVMIGGFRTPNAIALREPIADMGLPWVGVISAGTSVIEWDKGENKWMFRVSMKDRWVAPFLVDEALARSKDKKLALVYEATAWGQGAVPDVEAAAKAKGITLVGKETFNIADQDMSAQLIRLRDAGVDTIITYMVDREATQLLRSMERLGYKPTIISAWGISSQLGKTAGNLTDGILVAGTFAWNGNLSPRAQKVYEAMKAKYSLTSPNDILLPSGNANAYDAIYIIAEALKIAGAFDREKMVNAFYKVKYEGLTANFDPAFEKAAAGAKTERHDAIKPTQYRMLAFHENVLKPVEQTPYKR
ncbi:MAG: ABC transporter substrate-binding protein [Hyphomicrobiales bacterium]|nr:MAG: ABC transporter substrate-binding protein [Hyphomicrobiales bacterium]